jgi:hypothetical protein
MSSGSNSSSNGGVGGISSGGGVAGGLVGGVVGGVNGGLTGGEGDGVIGANMKNLFSRFIVSYIIVVGCWPITRIPSYAAFVFPFYAITSRV